MKKIILSLICLITQMTFATTLEVIQDGIKYSCTPSESESFESSCATLSRKKFGYIISDCEKIQGDAQDMCAVKSLEKNNYIISDCFKIIEGGRCAVLSLDKFSYIIGDCFKIKNRRQDLCAVDSIKTSGYITSSCFNLK